MNHEILLTIVFFFAMFASAVTILKSVNTILNVVISMYIKKKTFTHESGYIWILVIVLWTLFYYLTIIG